MDNMSRTRSSRAKSGDGTLIAYEQRGEGPPVVLVGGALCTAASDAPLAALLAPQFSVFTYDRRGRGASGDTAPYSVEREIEDLAAVIAQADGGAFVHGMSSGAELVLRAATAGLPITQLSVYEPPFVTSATAGAEPAAYVGRLRDLVAQGRRGDALALFLTEVGTPAEAIEGMRQTPMWAELEAVAHTLAYDHEIMGAGLVPVDRLRGLQTRVMVVDGGASPAWLREAARAVADALPHGRHRTLTGQTHEVAPQVLAPLLTEFFAA
ncbi:alpha/beta fold hydrolase [Streptomyces sp. ISL-1]|uniref:alpha/beta fold hydrolase n=1 Tax=Streptomyces sp. ISL-1 TaxID=2817657 RepID=UPI001BE957E3|nr:alpha/beta hydrolase [Streptomyces sp. ISL-1]MBT2390005.1 alpha/beta fold hydrolase [Streptomyces sp. ISL-1]